MKFENKGKWFGESAKRVKEEDLTNDEELALDEEAEDDFSDLLAEDELDVIDDEQPMNEVRYIDPANLDKYDKDDIEEVTKADGTKAYKRKSTGSMPAVKQEPAQTATQPSAADKYKKDMDKRPKGFSKNVT